MLDLIEKALAGENIEFQRLDGTKTFGQRRDALQKFRNNMSCNVLLASLGGAAVG
jgi:SNF2 family DNA or RNA helicase